MTTLFTPRAIGYARTPYRDRQDVPKGIGTKHVAEGTLAIEHAGTMTPVEFDRYVGDLVNYLVYMSEPAQESRKLWGIVVLFVLTGFAVLAYLLKREYWKDVR